jgi:hypothetical protein
VFQEQQQKFPDLLPKLKGIDGNLEYIAKQLQVTGETAKTGGTYQPIGTLGEFTLLVKTEVSMKEGFNFTENRFFVEHPQTKIKYSYNHGILAQDPEKACANFANALNHIPEIIEGYEHKNSDLIKPLPVLQDMVTKEWAKETELQHLKGELLKLESKINEKNIETKDKEAETPRQPFPTKIGGIELTPEQRIALANGKTIKMTGLTNKSGNKYTSDIRWNSNSKKIEYINCIQIKTLKEKTQQPEYSCRKKM